jgi:hypothetical protein
MFASLSPSRELASVPRPPCQTKATVAERSAGPRRSLDWSGLSALRAPDAVRLFLPGRVVALRLHRSRRSGDRFAAGSVARAPAPGRRPGACSFGANGSRRAPRESSFGQRNRTPRPPRDARLWRGGGPSRLRLRDLLRRGCGNQVGLPRRFPDRSRAVVCLRLERRSVALASRRWAVRRALRRPPAAVRTSSPLAACGLLSSAGVSTEGTTTIAGTGHAGTGQG